MVSPILNNNSSEVANYLKTYDKKIKKISEQFQNIFGYKEDELENMHINEFLKITKSHIEKLEYASTYFFKSNIPTKWGVSKEAIIIKVSIDYNEELFIFKEYLTENDFLHLQNSYVDKITGVQCKHSFNKSTNKDIDFFAVYIDIKNFLHISSFYGDDFAENLISDISKKLKKYFDLGSLYKIESDVFCIIKKKTEYYNFKEFEEEIDLRLKDIFECSTTNALPVKLDYVLGFAEGIGKNIFKRASVALIHAKENFLRKYIYDKETYSKKKNTFMEEVKVLSKIQAALDEDRIVPFYQPIYCNKENKVTKYECLARLREPNSSEYLSPAIFIDVAKKHNLNNEITKSIIAKSFDYFRDKKVDFSINLSFQALKDIEMYSFILTAVDSFPEPQRIIFEVIESEAMPLELFETNTLICELRKRKCSFALDDFGSGYSNLSMLTYFNYNYLKIDGSLISNIEQKASFETIKTIVKLAHNHNVKVVAEWVKSENTQQIVKELNIDYSQGFRFGKPEVEII